jgi:hypothetical protein
MTSDTPYPEPMHSKRPIPDNFGMALVLTPQKTAQSQAKISLEISQEPADKFADPELEHLRVAFPSGRSLPLLQAIATALTSAQGKAKKVVIDYLDELRLSVEVTPC